MPTSAAVQGDYVSVPDLHGRLVILDKSNTIIAVLGHNPDPDEAGELQHPAGPMDRRHLQRHARLVLGQRRQPLRARLERRRPDHEAGAGEVSPTIGPLASLVCFRARCGSIAMKFKLLIIPLALVVVASPLSAAKQKGAKSRGGPVTIDPALPNVLILGDSISIGYTPGVREELKAKANVIRPNANCGDTTIGLANIDAWLGDGKWDVIHFNWGLWDLCYRHPESKEQGRRDKVNGTQSTSTGGLRERISKRSSRDSSRPGPC